MCKRCAIVRVIGKGGAANWILKASITRAFDTATGTGSHKSGDHA